MSSVAVDALIGVHDRVALWHVDTEGAEMIVLKSAARLFAEGRVDRVILEWEPERFGAYGVTVADAVAFVTKLFDGWACRRLCETNVDWSRQYAWGHHHDVYCVRPGLVDSDPAVGFPTSACSNVG